jgi:hypothetical protein
MRRMLFFPTRCRAVIHALLATALLLSLTGCGLLGKRAREKRKAREAAAVRPAVPLRIGTITLVNEEEQFVLIDNGNSPTPPTGTALKSFTGTAESGVLSVGSVRRTPFVIADIVKGTPRKGDVVFQ